LIIAFVVCVSLGASLGSFLAVVVDRLPRGESLLAPPSRCRTCVQPIAPRDNVPIFSWFALRGRCRHCAAFIPLRFLVLEILGALGGAAFALAYVR
jgi:leader peptidase (prepilin peptidase)/N-methyltransferase